MMVEKMSCRSRITKASGSALIYILIAIALLAVLTASLIEPASQQSQTQNATNLVSDLQSQISLISSTIQECILTYPDQDSTLTSTQQQNAPYPINPLDSYFPVNTTDTPTAPLRGTTNNVSGIRCPGNPGGTTPKHVEHAKMFGGRSGKFLPPAPNLFGDWEYYNGADGVFVFISTTKTDAYITSALTKLNAKYSKCEADVIDATGGTKNLSTDVIGGASGVRTCANGSKCFRYWIIQKGSPVNADSGCPD